MPEICEVAITAQYLSEKLIGKKITKLEVISGKYTRLNLPGKDLLDRPTKIIKIDSKGKFLWFECENLFILNTFGMTGEWSFDNDKNARISFNIDDGSTVYFIDPRNMGNIIITNSRTILENKINS